MRKSRSAIFGLLGTGLVIIIVLLLGVANLATASPESNPAAQANAQNPSATPSGWPLTQTAIIQAATQTATAQPPSRTPNANELTATAIIRAATGTAIPATASPFTPPTSAPQNPVYLTATAVLSEATESYLATQFPEVPTLDPASNWETDYEVGVAILPAESVEEDMQLAAEIDVVEWVRVDASWSGIELEPGVYDWAELDRLLGAAEANDLHVLVRVYGTPDWAREYNADLDTDGPPANVGDFGDFLRELLNRYPGQVDALEIWQQMNLEQSWSSVWGLNPLDYYELLRVAHQVKMEVAPDMLLVSGALAPTGASTGLEDDQNAVDDVRYLRGMIDAGLLGLVDCVGAGHAGYNVGPLVPYNAVPLEVAGQFRPPVVNPHRSWSFNSTLLSYAGLIQQSETLVPVCVTEFGWASVADRPSTAPPVPGYEFAFDNDLDEQATYLVDALNLMQEWGIVRLAIVWNLNGGRGQDWSTPQGQSTAIYSLLRPNDQVAPALNRLRNLNLPDEN
jgi:hypothetical protein